MASVYSTRFIGTTGLVGTTSFVVPSGFVAIIRDIDAYANIDVTGGSVYAMGPEGQTFWFKQWAAEDQESGQWRGRQVCQEGETFSLRTTGVPIDVMASGYLLSMP